MGRFLPRSILVVAALAALATASVQAGAEISGKVLDTDGQPLKGVTIQFVPWGGEPTVEVATKKNGRFLYRGLPPGKYGVQTVDDGQFVASLTFAMQNDQGLTIGQGTIEGTPARATGPFPFSGRSNLLLELVVADRESDEARDRVLAFAAPELNAAGKLYTKGKFDRVLEATDAILADSPELGEAHYLRGIALMRLERAEEAAHALAQAAAKAPDYPGVWGVLGEARVDLAGELEQAGKADEARDVYGRAVEALEEARERGSENEGILFDLAKSLDHIDARERLVPVLEQILERQPNNLKAQLRLAALHSDRGNYERALSMLREVPATEKRAAVTIYNIAVQLNDGGDADGALLAATRAAEIDPDLPQPQQLMVQLNLARGDHPAAAKAIRRFLELAPDDPESEMYRRILGQRDGVDPANQRSPPPGPRPSPGGVGRGAMKNA